MYLPIRVCTYFMLQLDKRRERENDSACKCLASFSDSWTPCTTGREGRRERRGRTVCLHGETSVVTGPCQKKKERDHPFPSPPVSGLTSGLVHLFLDMFGPFFFRCGQLKKVFFFSFLRGDCLPQILLYILYLYRTFIAPKFFLSRIIIFSLSTRRVVLYYQYK